jgi:hypothetical protein
MEMILEIVLNVIIRGPGFLILRIFGSDSDDESLGCLLGLLFWIIVIGGIALIAKLSNVPL